jgi:hypothetical protein
MTNDKQQTPMSLQGHAGTLDVPQQPRLSEKQHVFIYADNPFTLVTSLAVRQITTYDDAQR